MQEMKQRMQVEQFPVAMAYVPWQTDARTFETLQEAYQKGTLFPELYKPFTGRRTCGC
ncbi:MAG: spore coat associated protein CotJA [Lachnospiraceae bacterium]|nr:spore coat associated protein CotJA [Lachnospiraceae bacterium]